LYIGLTGKTKAQRIIEQTHNAAKPSI